MSRRSEVDSEAAADWLAHRDLLRDETRPDPKDYEDLAHNPKVSTTHRRNPT